MKTLAIVKIKSGETATLTKSGWTVKPANADLQRLLNAIQPEPGRYFPVSWFGKAVAIREAGLGEIEFVEPFAQETGPEVVY